jgi:hypothetical protein
MKPFTVFLLGLLLALTTACSDHRPTRVVYVDRTSTQQSAVQPVYTEPTPQVLYSNCYVPGRGFLGDDGYYYPRNTAYRCNGVVYYDGARYHRPLSTLVGAMALGYYFGSAGPGYGNYGVHHTSVTNVKNVTVIKKGSPEYNKRMNRYSSIQKKRNKNKWVSKKERKRRAAQSKRDKARHQKKVAQQRKAQQRKAPPKKSSSFFSKSSSKKKKSSSWGTSSKSSSRKKSSSWGRSSSRSSFRSGRRFSDVRLKTNIKPLRNALHKVSKLKGVYFDYKNEEYDLDLSRKRQIGFIAQDVRKVLPEVVDMGAEGYYQVSYDKMTALLIQAIKEQQQQIDYLSNRCK